MQKQISLRAQYVFRQECLCMAFTRFTDHQRITLATIAHLVVPARTPWGAYATKIFFEKSSSY